MYPLAIVTHPDCLKHDPGHGHPERPARLEVILAALKAAPFADHLSFLDAPLASEEQILRVHSPQHLAFIRDTVPEEGYAAIDADTVMSPGSWNAALRAAGSGCAAVDLVMSGKARRAFCAVRPPGHHATRSRAMGFCLFNNLAIAIAHAMDAHGLERIAIVDFDVHHGNGTQDIFQNNHRVLFVSAHQWPLWPGSGGAAENISGHLLNLPLPPGTEGMRYRDIFTAQILPALRAHRPHLLFISAGFDAHVNDSLASLRLTERDYAWLGEQLTATADGHTEGRVISFLEGGYDLEALASSVCAYLTPQAMS